MLLAGIVAGVVVVTLTVALLFSFFRQPDTVDSGEFIPKDISRAEYESKFELKKSFNIPGRKEKNWSAGKRL
ncbi:MAG: hypothetical protein K8T10_11070 [Candidatus Eremiobacteraeota bacterium]|nr:hypothetical protein [Candidatus Eremiobacteraeota bacterium]